MSFGRASVDGFDEFAVRYSAVLLRSAYLLIGDRDEAEDVLQVTLLRTAMRWRAARDAPEAYTRQVLVNVTRDRWRRSTRRVREQRSSDLRSVSPAVSDHAEAIISRDAVVGAVRQLPVRQREVVVFRYFCELSVAETAHAIGSSEGTVKSYTARALRRMRELLADPPTTISPPLAKVPDDH